MRRSRPAVRHHDQPLAHRPQPRPHHGEQSLLRVFSRRQLGVQSRVDQPAEVPAGRRRVRRRSVHAHGRHAVHGAGDPRRPRRLSDREDRRDHAGAATARAGLRQPRRTADGARSALRLRRGPGLGGCHHLVDDGVGLRRERSHGSTRRPVRRFRRGSRRDARRARDASPRGSQRRQPWRGPRRSDRCGTHGVGHRRP